MIVRIGLPNTKGISKLCKTQVNRSLGNEEMNM